ncbi:MAG: rhomboid family intramembrane serine protease [Burkholderiaceae bacterium]
MQEFIDRLITATPRTWVTSSLITLNVAVFIVALWYGAGWFEPDAGTLLALGGNYLPRTHEQPWRLLSAIFLHAGILHLGFNMWVLRDVGRLAERFYGSGQFLVIYVSAGGLASLSSLFFAAADRVSVGASGAIFGVVGAILAAVSSTGGTMPAALVAQVRRSMLFFIAYALVSGFAFSVIDSAAHIGGLISGFLLALVLAKRFDWDRYRLQARRRGALAVATSLLLAVLTWQWLPAAGATMH